MIKLFLDEELEHPLKEIDFEGVGGVRRIFTETVPLVGKKTYRKLKVLFTVLDEDV